MLADVTDGLAEATASITKVFSGDAMSAAVTQRTARLMCAGNMSQLEEDTDLQLYDLDAAATRTINSLAGASVATDFLMVWISIIGVPLLVLAVAGQWWRGSDRSHNRHVLVATGLSFLLGLAINQIILLFVHRIRPYDGGVTHLLIDRSSDPSFPSDHATATFAIAAGFLLHGMRRVGRWFLAAAVLIAISRVYIGTHYVSDVLGGAATGIAAAMLVRALYREGTRVDRLVTGIL